LLLARDAIEDALDELVPPPVDEMLEEAMSEAPPKRGVAEGRRGTTYEVPRRTSKTPPP